MSDIGHRQNTRVPEDDLLGLNARQGIAKGKREDAKAIEGLRDWLCSDEAQYIGSMDGDTLDSLAERLVVHHMRLQLSSEILRDIEIAARAIRSSSWPLDMAQEMEMRSYRLEAFAKRANSA